MISTAGVVVRPASSALNATVVLTATISKGSASNTTQFILMVLKTPLSDTECVAAAKASLQIVYITPDTQSSVTQDLTLPIAGPNGTIISWASDPPGIISAAGAVTRPASTTSVTLTATITKGSASQTQTFTITVLQVPLTDVQAVANDKAALQITYASGDSASHVTGNLILTSTGPNGTTISWASDPPGIISAAGAVTRPTSTTPVTLTATITKGSVSDAKVFTVTVIISDTQAVANDKAALQITYASGDSVSSVTGNLTLPIAGSNGTTISWASDPPGIISAAGAVTRPNSTTPVTLTATITKGSESGTKAFAVMVIISDTQAVANDKAALQITYATGDSASSVTGNLTLPTAGSSGSTISWSSDQPSIVNATTGEVVRPTSTTSVTLTATITKGSASDTKVFTVTVTPGVNLTGYWQARITMATGETTESLIYLLQTDSLLNANHGGRGTVVGSVVTMEVPGVMVLTGTMQGSDKASGTIVSGGKGTWEITRAALNFGRFDLEGMWAGVPVSLHTYYGFGMKETTSTGFCIRYVDQDLEVYLWVNVAGDFHEGTFTMPRDAWVGLKWSPEAGQAVDEVGSDGPGMLTIMRYDQNGIAGSLTAGFSGGGTTTGSFNLNNWTVGGF